MEEYIINKMIIKIHHNNIDLYNQLFKLLNKLIPEKSEVKNLFVGIDQHSWSIPTITAINEIHDSILEIGAGTGLWAKLLNLKGINIRATDIGYLGDYFDYNTTFYPIEFIDGIDAIKKYSYNVLFMSWPPISKMAYIVLKNHKGNKLIYIGENKFGCTANDDFFKEWIKINDLSVISYTDNNGSGLFIRNVDKNEKLNL